MTPVRKPLVTLLLLSLLAAPARAQVSLTQSSVAGGGGVSAQGSLRVEGAVGQASAGASAGGSFTLHGGFFAPGAGPSVVSVTRASANPATQNSTVSYTVTFNTPVTGVDATDFQLTTSDLSGAGVAGVSGSGASYSVTVNTGAPAAGGGTLRLDVLDDDSITDAAGDRLGGAGAGAGGFTSGEVYTVNPLAARANDAQISEPSAGTAPLLFTVTLSAPATNSVSVNYATADGGAVPATGGVSCGGAADYESAAGTLSFAAGEQFKTVPVNVCSDADGSETDETLLLNLSGATGGTIQAAQANGVIKQGATAGALLISELRTSGPGGAGDDFVELYNNTDSPLTIAASDASAGYGVFKSGADCDSAPVLVGAIPNGTVIPARGHYLLAGSAYSLSNYGGTGAASPDLTMASDIEADRNVAVFTTSDVAAVSSARRLDAVGFGANTGGSTCDLLREGANLGAAGGSAQEHSFFRRQCDFVSGVGCPAGGDAKDSNDNAADFLFASTDGAPIAGTGQRLGAPGPENLSSPVRRDTSGVSAGLLDSTQPSSVEPNRRRDLTSDANAMFGRLSIRRRVTNNTGSPVTRLRFRIVELTTFPSPGGGQSDLRALSSSSVSVSAVNDPGTCSPAAAPCTVTVLGTTLEQPPAQGSGGGYNSTLAAGTVTAATPLANGASINLHFELGIETPGKFRFYIIVEALP